jgi:stage V sporulation protein AC
MKEENVMIDKERNKVYNQYVEAKIPRTKPFPSLLNSFLVGGLICLLGQGINDIILLIFPAMAGQTAWTFTLIILIFIASFLTGIGVYDKIGKFAGGGSIVPITGFSNSITSPAVEFKNEGIIFGMCVKMFSIAGPVIVCGIVASMAVGLVYLFI